MKVQRKYKCRPSTNLFWYYTGWQRYILRRAWFFICIPTYKSFHVRYLYVSIILNSMYVPMSHVSFDSTTQSIHNLPSSWLPAWNRLMSSILSRKIVSGPDIIYLMMYLMTWEVYKSICTWIYISKEQVSWW